MKNGHAQCTDDTSRETGTARGTARRPHFSRHYLRNRSTLDKGVLGYKEHPPDVLHIPPGHPV